MRLVGAVDKSPLFAGVSLAGFIGAGLVFGQIGGLIGELAFEESDNRAQKSGLADMQHSRPDPQPRHMRPPRPVDGITALPARG